MLSCPLPQLPSSHPRMPNLPKWINPCSAVLLYVKAVKVPTGITETLLGTTFQGLWGRKSIWYQSNASRKCQICSASTVETVYTCSINLSTGMFLAPSTQAGYCTCRGV